MNCGEKCDGSVALQIADGTATERRGYKKMAAGDFTGRSRASNVPFCETNPNCREAIFHANRYARGSYHEEAQKVIRVRFPKTMAMTIRRDDCCVLNFLEVTKGSAYARGQFFEECEPQHVGAGNAVRFGDSGAAVTGYESPTPKDFGVESHPNGEGGRVGLMPEVRITANVSVNNPSNQRSRVMFHRKTFAVTAAVMFTAAFITSQASADWTQFSLPNLTDAFSPTAIAVLPDGTYVFANEGTYYHQDAFGLPGYTAYSNVSPGNSADPSFLAVWDATHAVAGGGGFGASDLYRFDPASLTAPSFTAQGLSLQNFSGVFRDANSLYVGGGNGTNSTHAISYVNLNTASSKVIIDDISQFSCAFAQDAAGDLYVGDEDNQKVYKFTAAQLNLAIAGTPLSITNGTFVYQSINSLGSMAIDSEGRIWTSGFLENGLQVYDPASNTESTVVPGLTNANYMVTAFSVSGHYYVVYTDEANPFQGGTAQFFGFEAVPEPGTFGLAVAGLVALAAWRRNQRS
jgi:hypothetical protein